MNCCCSRWDNGHYFRCNKIGSKRVVMSHSDMCQQQQCWQVPNQTRLDYPTILSFQTTIFCSRTFLSVMVLEWTRLDCWTEMWKRWLRAEMKKKINILLRNTPTACARFQFWIWQIACCGERSQRRKTTAASHIFCRHLKMSHFFAVQFFILFATVFFSGASHEPYEMSVHHFA